MTSSFFEIDYITLVRRRSKNNISYKIFIHVEKKEILYF